MDKGAQVSVRFGGFEISARRVAPWRLSQTSSWLVVILLLSALLGVAGLDWGLPYQWHPDEKVQLADTMVQERSLEPPHFINPSLHAYATYAALRLAYALQPRQAIRYQMQPVVELTDPQHPDRPLQVLAFRLARLLSVIFQLATVLLMFEIARRLVDGTTGLVAAWFGAVTMGLVNMAHFATGESLLFLLCLWALWRFSFVADRGSWRDYAVAGLAAGLACSTKYTAVLLALPFLAAHVAGRGVRRALSLDGIARMALTFACTIGGFLAGSPYALLSWGRFRDGMVATWYTGAPSGTLAGLDRSWIPYLEILANSLGWPLFVLALGGLGFAIWRMMRRDTDVRVRHLFWIHASWILASYAFFGITPHRSLRFIMPIGPSLVLLAAVAAVALVRSARTPLLRRAAMGLVAAVGLYSTAYSVRAARMFVADTRYAAAEWLENRSLPKGMTVDYFAIEAYLPHFDRPPFHLRFIPFFPDMRYRDGGFWTEMYTYFNDPRNGVIVDAEFYYPRYFTPFYQSRVPERIHVYRMLFTGEGSPFRLVARITSHGPWWLDPRPELVCPEIVVFATRAAVPDNAVMPAMPPPREDVRRVIEDAEAVR
jgi:hypothetical protein